MRENHIAVAGKIITDWRVVERKSKVSSSAIYIAEATLAYDDGYYSTEGGEKKWVQKDVYVPLKFVSKNEKPVYVCDHKAHKFAEVYVTGRLCMDSWEKNGQKMTKLFVEVERIQQIKPSKYYVKPEGGVPYQNGGSIDVHQERAAAAAQAANTPDDDLPF